MVTLDSVASHSPGITKIKSRGGGGVITSIAYRSLYGVAACNKYIKILNYIFLSGILQHYSLLPEHPDTPPSDTEYIMGLTVTPKPFK